MRSAAVALVLGLGLRQLSAIHVAKGSPCETACGNVLDSTTKNDVVCGEKASPSTGAGNVYQQCVTCELTSGYSGTAGQTDTRWLLYNLQYALSYCLFGVPDNPDVSSNPCLTRTACEPLKKAVVQNDLAASNSTDYGYCSDWAHDRVLSCSACLVAGDNHYLNNYLTILDAGCQQKPKPGVTISVEGSPFSNTTVSIIQPTQSDTYVSNHDSGPVSLGAKVGIAIGGILLILIVAGFCVVWMGKRRRRAFLKNLEMSQQSGGGGGGGGDRLGLPTPLNTTGIGGTKPSRSWDDTPLSQKPLRSWDDTPSTQGHSRAWDESPLSVQGEKAFPRYFSPYSSQYNSPVSGAEAPSLQWPADNTVPRAPPQAATGMVPRGDDPQSSRIDSKGKERSESYELTEVEPDWDARQRHPSQRPSAPQYPEHHHHRQAGYVQPDCAPRPDGRGI